MPDPITCRLTFETALDLHQALVIVADLYDRATIHESGVEPEVAA